MQQAIIYKLFINLIEEMYIDREDYLNLLNKVDLLQQDNRLLTTENQILVAELERQKSLNYELILKMDSIKEHSQVLNQKIVNQNEVFHHDMKGYIGVLDQKQRKYLDSQFQHLEKSAFQKYRVLQIKNTVNRIENHELLQFTEKIRKIYRKTCSQQKQPSMKDMIKWIKSIAGKESEHQQQNMSGSKTVKKADDTGSTWKQSKVK